jgi:BlaI family transcriptional regulator, penicillinase repressor
MARPSLNRPTDGELAILRVLWGRGAGTVRDVYDELRGHRAIGYTTVLKLMQIMTEKKLLVRDERQRTHVYRARLPQTQTQRQLVSDLMEKAFGGSARALVLQALSARKASPQELAEIRALVDELEGDTP